MKSNRRRFFKSVAMAGSVAVLAPLQALSQQPVAKGPLTIGKIAKVFNDYAFEPIDKITLAAIADALGLRHEDVTFVAPGSVSVRSGRSEWEITWSNLPFQSDDATFVSSL